MTAFTVKGTCTVKQGRLCHTEKFTFRITALDEGDAVARAEVLATECAEINSGFGLDWRIASEVKIDSVREIPEVEILLSLPREVAPMLPGF